MTRSSTLARKLEPLRAQAAVREYSHSASGSAVPRRSAVIHRLHAIAPDDPRARRDQFAALLLIAGAAALAAVLGIFVFSHLLDRGDVMNPAEVALAAEGKVVYAVSCRSCHGANLQGANSGANLVPPPLDATGHAWLHSDADLFEMVKYGLADCGADASPTMPPLGSHLDDESIRAALAYIESTWPAPIRRVQSTLDSAQSNVAVAPGRPICSRLCRPVLASTDASQTAASP
jgi:mono/diheme cytochrome c family protein